jgi:endonuclease YncB( thermonuclease family)
VQDQYIRAATIVRVIDGDTVVVDVDLGFYVTVRMSCRLSGINANELNEPGGQEAKSFLFALLASANSVKVMSIHADKFAGRFDAIMVASYPNGDAININDMMANSGYAVVWDGRGTRPVVPWPIPVASVGV